MENGKIININGKKYSILKTFLKTKGSFNQKLVDEDNLLKIENLVIDDEMKFFLASNSVNNKRYWIKQNLNNRTENTEIEWNRNRKFDFSYKKNNFSVSPVQFFDRTKDCILMEYLEDYINIDKCALIDHKLIDNLKEFFIYFGNYMQNNILTFDLTVNNMMISHDEEKINIKLIDFDEARNRNYKNDVLRIMNILNRNRR